MLKVIINLLQFLIALILITACSASTGSRYEDSNGGNSGNGKEVEQEPEDDFDITPYKTRIELKDAEDGYSTIPGDVWYEFEDSASTGSNKIIGTTDGYRVLVVSADNIEEANKIRSEIYYNTSNRSVYISFEPPFYKVKVGDFISRSGAGDLKFKLNQLGYTEARVVQETVNLFE